MHIVSRSLPATPGLRNHLITIITFLVLLCATTIYALVFDKGLQLDEQLTRLVLTWRNPSIDQLALATTMTADLYFATLWIGILVLVLVVDRRWWPACHVLCAFFSTVLCVTIMKVLAQRARPEYTEALVSVMSFPSGHAARAVLVFGVTALVLSFGCSAVARKMMWGVASLLGILVMLSRVYLGVHWPSDVMAGALLGATLLTVVHWLLTVEHRRHSARRITPLIMIALSIATFASYYFYQVDALHVTYGLGTG